MSKAQQVPLFFFLHSILYQRIKIKFYFIGERARVHFVSKRVGGSKWVTSEFTVVRLSDNKSVDIGTPLTEAGEPLIEKQ